MLNPETFIQLQVSWFNKQRLPIFQFLVKLMQGLGWSTRQTITLSKFVETWDKLVTNEFFLLHSTSKILNHA